MVNTFYYLHVLSALHAGTGQGVGTIDAPIAREQTTGLPVVYGSGIKGVLRETLRDEDEDDSTHWKTLFGPEAATLNTATADGFAGALLVQDALLLCLPVRSVYGTFAWITCPFVLHRYDRDLVALGEPALASTAISLGNDDDGLMPGDESAVVRDNKLYLEEFEQNIQPGGVSVEEIAQHIGERVFPNDSTWQTLFRDRFVIVSDTRFQFLATYATEVRARIRLKADTRTIAKGGLWYEEYLPQESILWGVVSCDRSRNTAYPKGADTLMASFSGLLSPVGETRLQMGADATVGNGHVRWIQQNPPAATS